MRYFLIGCMLTLSVLSKAQSNYLKGYIVTNSKDTLNGFVDYKEKDLSPSSFKFKSALSDKAQIFSVDNAVEVNIENYVTYKWFVVSISQSKTDISSLSVGLDTATLRDTVFLEVLQKGNLTLYSYKDNIKKRFYVSDKDGTEPNELIRNLYFDTKQTTSVISQDKYQGQLIQLMRKNNGKIDERKFTRVKYTESELKKIVAGINGDVMVIPTTPSTRFFAGLGLNVSKASYTGKSEFTDTESKSAYSPMLTLGMDVLFNPKIGKLVFRTELSFLMNKGDFSASTDESFKKDLTHTFKQYSAVLFPQILYNFYNTNQFKVYAAVGAGLNFSKYSENVSTSTYLFDNTVKIEKDKVKLEAFNFSPQVAAGVVLNRKIQLSVGYSFKSAISDYSFFNVSMQRTSVGVSYIFNRK